MYARITHYQMKPDMVQDAIARLEQMKPAIMGLPGMRQFINTINADGSGCVVALVESREVSDANEEAVAQLWAQFADHLAAPPEPSGFDVIANWSA
ncbi:hypothetical protein [Roseovarius phycicola]|uniref:Antibiotic biosynthesis monooxygenase n=1 Tax=Roseovarius phycicola TaxID=3080976 RepID=A0ABZ2HQ30_9RHOB